MTTDELNAIVKAVMDELEKAGVDFDFKAETPQADDLVYVMRGTSDKYQGITVKWQNLLGIIVQKATEARDDAITAKDIALQTLATIQGIESNVSSMKSSVETMTNNVSSMKASVEASESNVTQMKTAVSEMKTSVEGTKTEVEGLKSDVTALKAQTQTIVDNAKEEVTGLLDTKVNYSDSLTYEEIMATTDLTNKVASASALKESSMVVSGSYTPSIISGGVASSISSLSYVKVGKIIYIYGIFNFTLTSTNNYFLDFSLPSLGNAIQANFGILGYSSNPNMPHYDTYVLVYNNYFRFYRNGSSITGSKFATDTQHRVDISFSYAIS